MEKTYEVHVRVIGYYITKVQAEDMDDAIEKAEEDFDLNCKLGDLEYADGKAYSIEGPGETRYLF